MTSKESLKNEAIKKYEVVLSAIPKHDPIRLQIEANKETMIGQFAEDMAYIRIMDSYIRKNSATGLGSLVAVYDDMR